MRGGPFPSFSFGIVPPTWSWIFLLTVVFFAPSHAARRGFNDPFFASHHARVRDMNERFEPHFALT